MFSRTFFQLIRRDLTIFRKEYLQKMIDVILTFITWVVIFGYFMPLMGGDNAGYGVFIMVGAVASFGIFDIIGQASTLIFDMKGDRTVSYLLLLPLSTTGVFCYMGLSWAIQSTIVGLPLYLLGKLIFWDQFDLHLISWHRLILGIFVTNLFFGAFAIWIAGALRNTTNVTRLYFRFINPLFLFGAYMFSWATAMRVSRPIGYLILLDPITYVMEIMRAAILGQGAYLPFWTSFFVLIGFSLLCGWHGIRCLRRHLDAI